MNRTYRVFRNIIEFWIFVKKYQLSIDKSLTRIERKLNVYLQARINKTLTDASLLKCVGEESRWRWRTYDETATAKAHHGPVGGGPDPPPRPQKRESSGPVSNGGTWSGGKRTSHLSSAMLPIKSRYHRSNFTLLLQGAGLWSLAPL